MTKPVSSEASLGLAGLQRLSSRVRAASRLIEAAMTPPGSLAALSEYEEVLARELAAIEALEGFVPAGPAAIAAASLRAQTAEVAALRSLLANTLAAAGAPAPTRTVASAGPVTGYGPRPAAPEQAPAAGWGEWSLVGEMQPGSPYNDQFLEAARALGF